MTPEQLGSLAWGERTDGLLTRSEAFRVGLGSLGQGVALLGSRTLQALRLHRDLVSVPLPTFETPDSPLARAVELAVEKPPESMIRHLRRTVAFAFAIKEHLQVPIADPELLWSACMLHDIGFQNPVDNHCFAVRGGLLARDLALAAGVSNSRADALGDAVSWHATPLLSRRQQPMAYLVAAGALADIFGLRLEHLDPDFVRDLMAAERRGDFSDVLASIWREEAKAVPRGRAAVADRLGFSLLARFPPKPLR